MRSESVLSLEGEGENKGRRTDRFHPRPASNAVVRPEVSVRRASWDPGTGEGGGPQGTGKARAVKACPTGRQCMTLWNYPVWLRWRTHAMDARGLSAGICLAPERDADLISTISAMPCALFYPFCKLSHGNLPLTMSQ